MSESTAVTVVAGEGSAAQSKSEEVAEVSQRGGNLFKVFYFHKKNLYFILFFCSVDI